MELGNHLNSKHSIRNRNDEAVSPVIAVILMVAITVVLAATVYVWVSGFGSQSSQPAKTLALSSAGAIASVPNPDGNGATGYDAHATKLYTVASATNGLKWADLGLSLNGTALDYADDSVTSRDYWTNAGASDGPRYCIVTSGTTCAASAPVLVTAGQQVKLAAHTVQGGEFRILDSQANSVILTLVVG